MFYFISILILIACVLLILVVLVQNSKGGGLAANFTSTGQTMGVRRTTDFLEKATWTLAIAVFALSLIAAATIDRGETEEETSPAVESEAPQPTQPTQPTQPAPLQPQ